MQSDSTLNFVNKPIYIMDYGNFSVINNHIRFYSGRTMIYSFRQEASYRPKTKDSYPI